MLNNELLKNLNAALQEDDKEKFVDLCVSEGITNASDYNNFHNLDVLQSTITETNNTFIDNLYKLVDDKNYTLLEHLDRFNAAGLFTKYYSVAYELQKGEYAYATINAYDDTTNDFTYRLTENLTNPDTALPEETSYIYKRGVGRDVLCI